jgi:hypothetical protein
LYLSPRFLCFRSDTPDACTVVLPFREVLSIEAANTGLTGTPARGKPAPGEPSLHLGSVYITTRDRSHFFVNDLAEPAGLIEAVEAAISAATYALRSDGGDALGGQVGTAAAAAAAAVVPGIAAEAVSLPVDAVSPDVAVIPILTAPLLVADSFFVNRKKVI